MTQNVPVLEVRNLKVAFPAAGRRMVAVNGVSVAVEPGESIGIVGESGSGKSTLARAVIGLLPDAESNIEGGQIVVEGREVPIRDLKTLRGKRIAMVFQDPLSYLNPIMAVGKQIAESVKLHDPAVPAVRRVEELLELVRLPTSMRFAYPHELSGGMRQRVLLAIALASRPQLLVADEPTTALDVTTQQEILHLIKKIQVEFRMSLMLVSHDLGVIASMCDRIYVMHRGVVVEAGSTHHIFHRPNHKYTQGLLAAARATRDESGRYVTADSGFLAEGSQADGAEAGIYDFRQSQDGADLAKSPVLELRGISKTFRRPDGELHIAVNDVSLSVSAGETLALVGESGSGKSTLARIALSLLRPDAGEVLLEGRPMLDLSPSDLRSHRILAQPIFQDSGAAFNPRRTVKNLLDQANWTGSLDDQALTARVLELLEQVNLSPGESFLNRFPHELSGGQRQRLAIARAIAMNPRLIIADEPLSGADVSIRGQILNLLLDLKAARGIAYFFITHDIAIAHTFADRVAVMYRGSIVERGLANEVISNPQHSYTRQLVDASIRILEDADVGRSM